MTKSSDKRNERKEAEKLAGPVGIRTFEILAKVTGFMEGGMDDWPSNIQDAVYEALERKAAEVQLPLAIVSSYCDKDIDDGTFYVRVIASEIVAADTRTTKH